MLVVLEHRELHVSNLKKIKCKGRGRRERFEIRNCFNLLSEGGVGCATSVYLGAKERNFKFSFFVARYQLFGIQSSSSRWISSYYNITL